MAKNFLFTKLRVALIKSAIKRTDYLVKHGIFQSVGEHFFFQPRIIPQDAKLIKFGNNVVVAAGVKFINHDVIHKMLNHLPNNSHKFTKKYSCIEICDNVFIGANVIIMGDVKIGSNVIVAAGAIVTKDIPDNSIVAGVPAKVIGDFDSYLQKTMDEERIATIGDYEEADVYHCWKRFNDEHL